MKRKTSWVTEAALLLAALGCLCFTDCVLAQDADLPAAATNSTPRKPNVKAWKKDREAAKKALAARNKAEAGTFLEAALTEAEAFDAKDYRLAKH